MEAMAYGCPTIYSRRSSGPELIRHGRDGLLIEPDRPDEIARAILSVLEDDALAARLGQEGRRRIMGNFTIDQTLPATLAFYTKCIQQFRAHNNRA
jgi:glycosyltransferase involved in cell wall biosynthesis